MDSKSPSERVAHSIREALKSTKVTQHALAAHLDISQQAVSRRLVGKVPFPYDEVVATAQLLNLELSALTGDTSSDTPALAAGPQSSAVAADTTENKSEGQRSGATLSPSVGIGAEDVPPASSALPTSAVAS